MDTLEVREAVHWVAVGHGVAVPITVLRLLEQKSRCLNQTHLMPLVLLFGFIATQGNQSSSLGVCSKLRKARKPNSVRETEPWNQR